MGSLKFSNIMISVMHGGLKIAPEGASQRRCSYGTGAVLRICILELTTLYLTFRAAHLAQWNLCEKLMFFFLFFFVLFGSELLCRFH